MCVCVYRVIWYGVDKGDMYVDESAKISPKNRHGYRGGGDFLISQPPSALIARVMRHFHTPNGAPRIAKQHFVLMGNDVYARYNTLPLLQRQSTMVLPTSCRHPPTSFYRKLSTLATRPSTCFSTDQPEFSNTLMFFQTSPLPTSRDVSDICGIFLRFSRGVPLLRPLEWLRGRGNLQFCIADLRIGTFVNY